MRRWGGGTDRSSAGGPPARLGWIAVATMLVGLTAQRTTGIRAASCPSTSSARSSYIHSAIALGTAAAGLAAALFYAASHRRPVSTYFLIGGLVRRVAGNTTCARRRRVPQPPRARRLFATASLVGVPLLSASGPSCWWCGNACRRRLPVKLARPCWLVASPSTRCSSCGARPSGSRGPRARQSPPQRSRPSLAGLRRAGRHHPRDRCTPVPCSTSRWRRCPPCRLPGSR